MIKEIRDFKLKQLENKLEEYKEIKEKINQKQQEIKLLQDEIQEKTELIPYKKFNWIQKHITQRKEYREYKKINEYNSETIDLSSKEIKFLKKDIEQFILESMKIDHLQLELQIEEIRRSKNIRRIRIRF